MSYPFDRVLLEGRLHFTVSLTRSSDDYSASVITEFGNKYIEMSSFIDRVCDGNTPSIYYYAKGKTVIRNIVKKLNIDVFAFFLFFILCGFIHAVWSIVIRIQFGSQILGRLLSNYSFLMSMVLFSFCWYLLNPRMYICVVMTSLMAAGVMITASIYLFGKKFPRLMLVSGAILISSAVAVTGLFVEHELILFSVFGVNVASFAVCIVAAVVRMIRNRNISKRIVVLLIMGMTISMAMPFMVLSYSLIHDTSIPVSYYMVFSLLMPLVMSNNFESDNLRYVLSVRKRYFLRLFLDIIAAFCTVIVFQVIVTKAVNGIPGEYYHYVLIPGIIILLLIRKKMFDLIRDENPVYRNIFADAVRRVSEISASPIEFNEKVNKTYEVIKEVTGVRFAHIELFEMSIANKIAGLEEIISYSKGTPVEKHFNRNTTLLNRNDFFSSSMFEILQIANQNIEIIVPIRSKQFTIGVLHAGDKENGQPLADDEVTFLNSLSVVFYQMIENEMLFKEYMLKREYEREIDIASYIQMRLFPKRLPIGKGIHIAHYSRPFLKVTGDYYDFIDIDDKRTLVAIGDVAGHGLSAATILAVVGNIIHAMVREGRDEKEIMNELNHFFSVRYRGTELMTLFLIVYDNTDNSVTYINAGHCEPYIYRNGGFMENVLSEKSPILGASRNIEYTSSRIIMKKGDEIILYTDGIIEIEGDKFGNNVGDRILLEALSECCSLDIDQKISAFAGKIEKFPRHAIHDDITVIGIKVL
ncbi:MAG TPA: PP2C family protein-serine/threonine phosphatase [Spirochaetota bacterium]|nr:PP2C family protein-serine/threonine phosphatase [Spirochaetota bacterium]